MLVVGASSADALLSLLLVDAKAIKSFSSCPCAAACAGEVNGGGTGTTHEERFLKGDRGFVGAGRRNEREVEEGVEGDDNEKDDGGAA